MTLKSPLKYLGGKAQLLPKLNKLLPKRISSYRECFLGGGSLLFHVLAEADAQRIELGTVSVSDINANLVDFYVDVRDNLDALLCRLTALFAAYEASPIEAKEAETRRRSKVHPKETLAESVLTSQSAVYYFLRAEYNRLKASSALTVADRTYKSALFLFLNKTSFRGLHRENKGGLFNVPFGHYKSVNLDETNLRAVSAALRKWKVEIKCQSFTALNDLPSLHEDTVDALAAGIAAVSLADKDSNPRPEHFVYLDPPYYPVAASSFTDYSTEGFGEEDHAAVIALCRQLQTRGYRWVMSNAACGYITAGFEGISGVSIDRVSCRRAIHSADPAAKADELIVHNSP